MASGFAAGWALVMLVFGYVGGVAAALAVIVLAVLVFAVVLRSDTLDRWVNGVLDFVTGRRRNKGRRGR